MTFRLSVVIPALDEQACLGATLARVMQAEPHEVIVVDGCSDDRTVEVAKGAGAHVLFAGPGRARQMNAGAMLATGDALLFLHADTLPPVDYAQHVQTILDQPGVSGGAFRFRLDADRRSLRMVEVLTNWRGRVLQRPYGDQGLFTSAEMFRRVGGFPDVPIMEDPMFVRRLRRHGRIRIASAPMLISARRWRQHGVLRTTFVNQACLSAFSLGVSPQRIARWRGRVPHHPDPAERDPALLQRCAIPGIEVDHGASDRLH